MHHLIRPTLLALCFALPLPGWAGPVEDVQKLLNQQDYELALSLAERHLKSDKRNEQLLLQKGYALIYMEEYTQAISHYKKLARWFKENPEPSNNLGIIYRLQGNYDTAIKQLRATTKKYPTYARAWENLGDTYIMMAEQEYKNGLEQIPGNDMLTTKRNISQNFSSIAANNSQAALQQKQEIAQQQAAQQQAQAAAQPGTVEGQIVEMLKGWVDSWSSLDPNQYLSHYSNEFVPSTGITQGEWVEQVKLDMAQSAFIRVFLDDIRITRNAPDVASVQFRQKFQSDRLNTDTAKALTLKNYGEQWLIVNEVNLGS